MPTAANRWVDCDRNEDRPLQIAAVELHSGFNETQSAGRQTPTCTSHSPVAGTPDSSGLSAELIQNRLIVAPDEARRFWSKVNKIPGGCWEWTGANRNKGYGGFWIQNQMMYAHRIAYELCRGLIPPGLDIDHLCRNHCCVNPSHLEIVTRRTNLLRGLTLAAINAAKTACPRGHALSEDNVYRRGNRRQCRQCAMERGRRQSAARRAGVA